MLLRVCMDRIASRAARPGGFRLSKIASASDALGALEDIVRGRRWRADRDRRCQVAMLVRLISQVAAETDHEQRIKQLEGVAAQIAKSK